MGWRKASIEHFTLVKAAWTLWQWVLLAFLNVDLNKVAMLRLAPLNQGILYLSFSALFLFWAMQKRKEAEIKVMIKPKQVCP